MTIADKLTQLNTIKQDIKTAINNNGGSVANNFTTYAAAITNLPSGVPNGTIIYGKADVVTIEPYDATVKTIGDYDFRSWTHATGLVVGEGFEVIEQYAFQGWTSAISLKLPSTLKTIGQYAFADWTSVTGHLEISDSVTSIGTSAFQGNKFTSAKIGNGITSLPTGGLGASTQMLNLDIGSSVASIAANFLINAISMQVIIVRAVNPPSVNASGTFFGGLPAGALIKVPSASVDAYKTASGWSVHASKITSL